MLDIGFVGGFGGGSKPLPTPAAPKPTPQAAQKPAAAVTAPKPAAAAEQTPAAAAPKPAAAAIPARGAVPNSDLGHSSSRRSSSDSHTPYGPGSRGDSNRGDGHAGNGHNGAHSGNHNGGGRSGGYDKDHSSGAATRPYYPQKSYDGWWNSGSMFTPGGPSKYEPEPPTLRTIVALASMLHVRGQLSLSQGPEPWRHSLHL
jgi:hypothetical protein